MFGWFKRDTRPEWRIVQDSHTLEYQAEKLCGNWAGGSDFYCKTGIKSLDQAVVEAWVEAERRNNLVIKEIP